MARWSFIPLLFLLLPGLPAGAAAGPGAIQFGRFGAVPVVHPQGEPAQVVLLLSGGEGLGAKESEMASALARQGALVFEIDTAHYLQAVDRGKNRCIFPAADFEGLSQFGQQTLGLAAYRPPILVGTGAGSALAYGALAQAPPNTFAGAVSAGFCAVLDSPRQLCPENGLKRDRAWKQGGQHLLPNPGIEAPWIILQSPTDAQCSAGPFGDFNEDIPNSQVIPLPAAGSKAPAAEA
jgi:type IV secretory pathway VirJ component